MKSEQDEASLCPRSQATGDFCEEGWSLETWKLCSTQRQPDGALSWVTAAGSQDPSEKPEVVAWAPGQQRIWKDCQGLYGSASTSPQTRRESCPMGDTVVKFPTVWTAQPLPGGQTPGHEVEYTQAKGHRCGCGQGYWALATERQCTPSQDAEGGAGTEDAESKNSAWTTGCLAYSPGKRCTPALFSQGHPGVNATSPQRKQTTTERNGSISWVWGGQKPCIRGQTTTP